MLWGYYFINTQYFHQDNDESLCNNTVWDIKEIDGELWIGTSSGLSIFNKKTKKFISFFLSISNPNSLPNNFVLSILKTKNGAIWIDTANGLSKVESRKKEQFIFQQIHSNVNDKSLFVQKIKEDALGDLWIGTKTSGIYKYETKTKKLISLIADGKQNGIDVDV